MNKLMRLSFIVLGTMLMVPCVRGQQKESAVPVQEKAPPAPVVSLLPATVTFTEQAVKTTSPARRVLLTNTGTATLNVASVTFEGANAADFTVLANTCGAPLAAGASCTISVIFSPTDVSNRNGTLTVTDNAAGSPHVVQLEGYGLTAQEEIPTTPADELKSSSTLAPDNSRPLSGVEDLQVESPARARNFVVPSLRLSAFGDSNRRILGTGTTGLEMTGSIVGNIAAHHINRRNEFSLDYMGGAMIYARNSELNAMIHQMGFTETYTGRRWGITIGDRLSYLPESAYGFGGFGPSIGFGGGFGGGMGNWNPSSGGGQNLYTGRGNRIANNAMTQLMYNASARSSLTFSGSYGLLRFLDPGGIESDFGAASAGYNYALNKRDTIAVSYGFGAFRFKGSDFQMDNHSVNLLYGRKLTGRLAFELSGGPQFTMTRIPALGSRTRTSWNAHTSLSSRISRTSLGFSYSHYTSAGSGLLFGATTDRFYGSIGRQLTRHWHWSVGPGYSRNARLAQGPTAGPASAYNSVNASTGLNRALGEYTDLSFSYSLHNQWSDAQNPNGINQGSAYRRHTFGVSLTFHTPRIAMN